MKLAVAQIDSRVVSAPTAGSSPGLASSCTCGGVAATDSPSHCQPVGLNAQMSVAGVRLRGMKAGRRFRVELTDAQARLAQQTADACRAVWNTGLEQRREYRRRGAWINCEEQAHELVEAKMRG